MQGVLDLKTRREAGGWKGLCEGRTEFFERDVVFVDINGDFFADIAEMPRFVGVTGDVFFPFGEAKNETVGCELCVDFSEGFAVGNHFFVVAFLCAIGLDNENVDGETSVMFGISDAGEVFFAVFRSELGVGRPFVPDFLLFLKRTIGAVDFDLDSFGQEFFTKSLEMF